MSFETDLLARGGGRRLDVIDVEGRGFEAGQRYGTLARDLIQKHLEQALAQLSRAGIASDIAFEGVHPFRAAVTAEFPDLAAEVDGVAAGAGLPLSGAWVLQMRAELLQMARQGSDECTAFAVMAAENNGHSFAGQNADLPAFYSDLMVLLRRTGTGGPDVITVTPAGQLGYHGINRAGVAVFANFLHIDEWRIGIPRYLYTRIALGEVDREASVAAVEFATRSSPRNLLIVDGQGAIDLETCPSATGRIEPADGLLAHTNHLMTSALQHRERSVGKSLQNSHQRLDRLSALLVAGRGRHDVSSLAEIMRDREGVPNSISRAHGEWEDDVITVASTIADIEERRLWVATGPPHLAQYFPYGFAVA